MMIEVDLSGVGIVDAHTHPYRLEDLLAKGSAGFDTRAMFLGESFQSSSRLDPRAVAVRRRAHGLDRLRDRARRWLARHLGCEPTREAVTAARDAALRADAGRATRRASWTPPGVVAVLSDEGYPQPPIPATEFAASIGVPVHRVARLEPWILRHRDGNFDDLVSGIHSEAQEAAARPELRRVQVDRRVPDGAGRRRSVAFRGRGGVRPLGEGRVARDARAREAGPRLPDPAHARGGEGERPAIPLPLRRRRSRHQPRARQPESMFPLLVDVQDQPVVLVHSGYPWIREAAYIASVLPNVYLELSELIPWGWGQVEWALEMLVGTVPAAKLLYGSDEAGEPEAFWVSALLARPALERVLGRFVERDYVSGGRGERLGSLVLAGSCRALHGIDG